MKSLIDEGLIWIPEPDQFQPWSSFKGAEGWWDVESYYSIYQTLPLFKFIESTNLTLGMEKIASWSSGDAMKWFEMWEPHTKRAMSIFRDGESAFDKAAKLCQVLSNRYLPYAQSDRALISIPHPDFFDWDKFRREWDAKSFLGDLGISAAKTSL